tara:strand:- start:201 stop:404 length:204 start_codon:yes stop_codon:yes gene_type:complete
LIKKKYIQAFDKSALLTSYCETSSELDQGIIEFLADREDYNSTGFYEQNSNSHYKSENHKFYWKKNG